MVSGHSTVLANLTVMTFEGLLDSQSEPLFYTASDCRYVTLLLNSNQMIELKSTKPWTTKALPQHNLEREIFKQPYFSHFFVSFQAFHPQELLKEYSEA